MTLVCLIFGKTTDVERALSKPKRDLEDFKALISPAAEPYLEQMAQQSLALTRKRFVIRCRFIFLCTYLTCALTCTYCGFSMENRIKRRTLTLDEIDAESAAIKRYEVR